MIAPLQNGAGPIRVTGSHDEKCMGGFHVKVEGGTRTGHQTKSAGVIILGFSECMLRKGGNLGVYMGPIKPELLSRNKLNSHRDNFGTKKISPFPGVTMFPQN